MDVSKVPNAQAVNEWLFPNIRLFFDDGTALRWENHYSINEPDDIFLLMFSTQGLELLGEIVPLELPKGAINGGMVPNPAPAAPPPALLPVPKKIEAPPKVLAPGNAMCPATAVESDGMILVLVPTLCVGTHALTLCVTNESPSGAAADSRARRAVCS